MIRVAMQPSRAFAGSMLLRYALAMMLFPAAFLLLPEEPFMVRFAVWALCDLISTSLAGWAFFHLAGDMILITPNPSDRRGKARLL